ncbi:MAG: ATP-binding protein [Deltaproteobacteria bacterium]|nr:ATP-binding protein [Deltaproteobacteria bacterium]
MDALLIDRWLEGSPYLATIDDASAALAREEVRVTGAQLGLPAEAIAELAIAVSELVSNQIRHARFGRIAVRGIERDGVRGLEIVAADRGPGIADPTAALLGTPRISGSLGTGVSAVMKFSDEVDFDVRLGEGTCVWARRFARPVARRREVAMLARPLVGERASGDDGTFFRREGALIVALADGLGHGPQAREASAAAIDAVRRPFADHHELFLRANEELVSTRGAVMTVVEIDEALDVVQQTAVGNVSAMIVGKDGLRTFLAPSMILGPHRDALRGRTRTERHALSSSRDVVVLFSDGLTTKTRLDVRDEVVRAHPLRIAHHLLGAFGRDNDDATVLVVA